MKMHEMELPCRPASSLKRFFKRSGPGFDARESERYESCVFGFIHADNISCRECIVQNYSDDGARINTLGAPSPEIFTLEIPSKRLMRPSKVIWRRGSEMGVRFR